MQSWQVQGADKETGKDVVHTLQAETKEQAAEAARALGVFVTSVMPVLPIAPTPEPRITVEGLQLSAIEQHLRAIRYWVTFIGTLVLIGLILTRIAAFLGLVSRGAPSP